MSMPPQSAAKRKPGRPPIADETATERIELKLTPSQLASWLEIGKARGLKTVKQLVVEAVAAYGARDEEGELADLGREVLALADDHRRGRSAR